MEIHLDSDVVKTLCGEKIKKITKEVTEHNSKRLSLIEEGLSRAKYIFNLFFKNSYRENFTSLDLLRVKQDYIDLMPEGFSIDFNYDGIMKIRGMLDREGEVRIILDSEGERINTVYYTFILSYPTYPTIRDLDEELYAIKYLLTCLPESGKVTLTDEEYLMIKGENYD